MHVEVVFVEYNILVYITETVFVEYSINVYMEVVFDECCI